jgi:hypothetical protein
VLDADGPERHEKVVRCSEVQQRAEPMPPKNKGLGPVFGPVFSIYSGAFVFRLRALTCLFWFPSEMSERYIKKEKEGNWWMAGNSVGIGCAVNKAPTPFR